MSVEFDLIRQLHPFFWKNNIYFGIYLACLFLLFLFRKKEQWKSAYRSIFWYSVVAMIAVCYNPIFARLTFWKLFLQDMSVYIRVFLILPVILTVAYVLTGLIGKLPRIWGDVVIVAVAVVIILFGETPSDHNMYMAAENPFKINSQAVQICDMIEEDLEPGERCVIVMPSKLDETYGTDLVIYGIRQYDSNMMIYPRFPTEVSEEEIASGEFREFLERRENYEEPVYMVCLHDELVENALESYGYKKLGETEHFSVMRLDEG